MKKGKTGTSKARPTVAKKAAVKVVPKRGRGQPTIFTAALGHTICERLSRGESLRSVCRDPAMPAINTILGWLFDEKHVAFSKDYDRARDIQAQVIFEETIEIADGALKVVSKGKVSTASARVNAVRLQMDTRRWALGRMAPKRFGEKIDVTSGGKEIKGPRPVAIQYLVPKAPAAPAS